jgi:hypothetical protein
LVLVSPPTKSTSITTEKSISEKSADTEEVLAAKYILVKEIASDVSLALTFADGYSSNSPRLIPKEVTDAAGVASKIVPEAAAADDTCGFAEEAKKVRYIFFDSFYQTSFVVSIARKSQLIFYFFYFFLFFLTCSLLNLIYIS